MSIDAYITKVTRTTEPDGTITEITEYFDRGTGVKVRRVRRHMSADGSTMLDGSEIWYHGPVETRITWERYEDGRLRRTETWQIDPNGGVTGKTFGEHEGGDLRQRREHGPAPDYPLLGTFTYGYDRQHRWIRIEERDENGTVKKVTTRDYLSDGSYSVTVTDYSTSPATVTRTEYDVNGIPR